MSYAESILPEFDQETANTRKLLECVPDELLNWSAGPGFKTVGWNANHLAEIVGWVGGTLTQTEWNIAPEGGPAYQSPALTSRDEILALFDSNLAEARKAIEAVDEAELDVMWQLKHGEQVLFNLPRRAVIRTFVINHLIHHRAHLSVYLRLNAVKVPFMYGG